MGTHRDFDKNDDRTVEEVLAGRSCSEHAELDGLALFVTELRAVQAEPMVVGPELAAIFDDGVLPTTAGATTAAADQPPRTTSRRRRMLTALSTFVATLTGKAVLSTTAVAVGVGGIHTAGVVDVPGLPDKAASVSQESGAAAEVQASNQLDAELADPGVDSKPVEDGRELGQDVADDATGDNPEEFLEPCGDNDDGETKAPDFEARAGDETPRADVDASAEARTEGEANVDTNVETGADASADAETGADLAGEANVDTNVETGADASADAEAGAGVAGEATADPTATDRLNDCADDHAEKLDIPTPDVPQPDVTESHTPDSSTSEPSTSEPSTSEPSTSENGDEKGQSETDTTDVLPTDPPAVDSEDLTDDHRPDTESVLP